MADEVKPGAAATQGAAVSLTREEIAQIAADAATAALKPFAERIGKLEAPPAPAAPAAAAAAAATEKTKETGPKFLTADDLNAALDAREAKKASSQAAIDARRTFLTAKNPKLLGTRFESMLGDDPAKFEENLAGITGDIGKIIPGADFGGAARGGGATPDKKEAALNANLPEGVAKYANSIEIPKQ